MNSLIILFIVVPVLVLILLAANLLFSVHRPDSEKLTSYECGFSPIHGQTRAPFSIQFYLVAILFLVFDLEILLVSPYVVSAYVNAIFGLIIMLVFFIILTLGFAFELGKNALKIDSRQNNNTQFKPQRQIVNFSTHKKV